MKILVIAPHPDDEVLGCGGTISKYSKMGHEVFLCVVTKAYMPDWTAEFIKNRPKEVWRANRILGIKKTYFLNFPTVKLDTIPQKELNEAILKVVEEIKPEVVYVPHRGDLNKDHRLVFESALVATRPIKGNSVKKLLSYETLSETEWGLGGPGEFIPRVYQDISEEIGIKIKAMEAYGDQLYEFPHPRSKEGIEILAKKRGSEVGLRFAEAFVLVREILN